MRALPSCVMVRSASSIPLLLLYIPLEMPPLHRPSPGQRASGVFLILILSAPTALRPLLVSLCVCHWPPSQLCFLLCPPPPPLYIGMYRTSPIKGNTEDTAQMWLKNSMRVTQKDRP